MKIYMLLKNKYRFKLFARVTIFFKITAFVFPLYTILVDLQLHDWIIRMNRETEHSKDSHWRINTRFPYLLKAAWCQAFPIMTASSSAIFRQQPPFDSAIFKPIDPWMRKHVKSSVMMRPSRLSQTNPIWMKKMTLVHSRFLFYALIYIANYFSEFG